MKILHFCWTTFGNKITHWKKCSSRLRVNMSYPHRYTHGYVLYGMIIAWNPWFAKLLTKSRKWINVLMSRKAMYLFWTQDNWGVELWNFNHKSCCCLHLPLGFKNIFIQYTTTFINQLPNNGSVLLWDLTATVISFPMPEYPVQTSGTYPTCIRCQTSCVVLWRYHKEARRPAVIQVKHPINGTKRQWLSIYGVSDYICSQFRCPLISNAHILICHSIHGTYFPQNQ